MIINTVIRSPLSNQSSSLKRLHKLFLIRSSRVRKMASNHSETSNKISVVGVVQMNTNADKESNWQQGEELVKRASQLGAQMVFLPECFDYVGPGGKEKSFELAETIEENLISQYKKLAKSLGVWISLGGMHEKTVKSAEIGKLYNSHLVINSAGDICGRYSKTHLFDVNIPGSVRLQERDFVIPGENIGTPIDTPIGRLGLGICYDLRFPEFSIALRQQGADILTFPSAFTVPTGMAHWESLLRSRAIENQCYVIAAAQVGQHTEKRSSYGHSMVVDPWGCIVAECSDKVGVIIAEIDHEYIEKRRQGMPVQSHRRHDLYGHIQIRSKVDPDEQPEYVFGKVKVNSSSVFHRTALSYAFVNRKPVLKGHVLVSPIREVARFSELTKDEVSDLFVLTQQVGSIIEKHCDAKSLTVTIQDGPDAGQSIEHVHVHILPRRPGDFQRNDDIYDKLETHDKDVAAEAWRTDDDMKQEANILRHYFI